METETEPTGGPGRLAWLYWPALALAERPFGELMLDKWRGVAANAAKS